MGNDGGSIVKAHNLKISIEKGQNTAKDDDKRTFQDTVKWNCCRLSNKELQLPVVSDYKGYLYNKEAILEWLLTPGKEDYTQQQVTHFSHIRKLHDVVELHNLVEHDSALKCAYGDDYLGNNNINFVYLVTCGDVLPKKSLQLAKKDTERNCPNCLAPYTQDDIITINPETAETIELLEKRFTRLTAEGVHHDGSLIKKKTKSSDVTKRKRLKH